MKFSVSGIAKQFGEFYKKLGKATKIFIFTALGIVAVGAVILTVIINNGKYSELYTGLSTTEAAEIYSVLQDMAVDVQVKNDTTILVPTDQVASLKMQLAVKGYPKSTLSYDIFTNQSDLFTTDYEKKQYLIFQLQDRIQESIKTLQDVKDAIVTLSIKEDNSYVLKDDEVPTTASVILKTDPDTELTESQINGIENLVANSVSGLKKENVVIVDGDGVQLNSDDKNAGPGGAYGKVATVNTINTVYEKKIRDFLKPVLGPDGMSVAVNVKVDFNVISSEDTIYTPVVGNDGVVSWVEKSGQSLSGTDSGSDTPTYTESSDTGTSSLTNSDSSSSGTSESYSAEYLVNQSIKKIEDNGGNITDISVALVVNASQLSDQDIQNYKQLVAYSTGISADKVVVSAAQFLDSSSGSAPQPDNPSTSTSSFMDKIMIVGIAGVAVALLIILFIVMKSVMRKKKMKRSYEAQMKNEKLEDAVQGKTAPEDMPGEIVLNETREQALKRQIKEYSAENPETVAQLLRVWIKEDENK